MDQNAIRAEISAQSKLVEGIALDQAMVTEIDRHIKEQENKLNEKLVHFPTRLMLKDFLPQIPMNQTVTKVDGEMWKGLHFIKSWKSSSDFEEISYEKCSKGYAFFYRIGEVTYDIGFRPGPVGRMECYFKIVEDRRETIKVTGASVEIKLRAFRNLRPLLTMIANQANHVAAIHNNRDSEVDGNRDLSRTKVNQREIGSMGQMETLNHLRQPSDLKTPNSGKPQNRMSLDLKEAFSPAELAEINRNYNRTLF